MAGIADLICGKKILVVAGSGGVGKTTVAAALGLASAYLGKRVLVLTVDPAKRLADAMGMDGLDSQVERVSPQEIAEALGRPVSGEFYAAMLDAESSWDKLIVRHAPDDATREKILGNAIYKNISSRFVQSHHYIAMETLFELYSSGRYDLIIVDTPPSRHAIDFLDAPAKMAEFFSSKLLRWLTLSSRNKLLMGAFKPFNQVADRILGAQFLSDVSEFFLLFQSMYEGFVDRAESVSGLLGDPDTSFVVVASPEPAPIQEADYFISALDSRDLHLGQMVVNRVLPDYFRDPGAVLAAHRMQDGYGELAHSFVEKGARLRVIKNADISQARLEALAERVFLEVAGSFLDFSSVAVQEADQIANLPVDGDLVTLVPHLSFDVSDLKSLGKVVRYLLFDGESFTM